MDYISVTQAAEKWGLSTRRIRMLCSEGKIDGVKLKNKYYMIPADAEKPLDHRPLRHKTVSKNLVPLFLQIDKKRLELDKLRPLTAIEAQRLREDFILDFTYNSNAIDGNILNRKETAMVLEGITIDKKPLKDHLEVVGHRNAFLYIEEISRRKLKLREAEIKNIHSLVLMNRPEDKGVYRRTPVAVTGTYIPIQPYLIELKMAELIAENEKRKKGMHTIERIARFHLEFKGICPFIEGNGRTSRLILNLELLRNGYPAININFSDRQRYYCAFDAYYRDGNADDMAAFIGEYVNARLDKYLEILS